jgi:hypothetical protein
MTRPTLALAALTFVASQAPDPVRSAPNAGRRGARTAFRLAGRSDLAVFPWTRECGPSPIRV